MGTKLAISFGAFVLVLTIAIGYVTSGFANPALKMFTIVVIVITFGEIIIVDRIITKSILAPLARLRQASKQIANGKYDFELVAKGKAKLRKRDSEILQIIDGFEKLRKRALELEKSFTKVDEESEKAREEASNSIAEKERELERKNAMLIGKAEELETTIKELSARNQELTDAYTKLQTLDKNKTEFLLIAAHELRTPIQPILGFARLAEKGLLDRDAAWKSIETEAKKLANMASDILDAGRIENGTFSYKMKPVSVRELLEEVTSGSTKLFNGSGATAIVRDFDEDIQIKGDKVRLTQALSNIVGNAVKFSQNAHITIKSRNVHDIGFVEIRVIDEGVGIDPEVLPVLFNKFVTKTEANQRGAGLGLYITRSIIEAHGGKVSAENNAKGTGATFIVSLPIMIRGREVEEQAEDLESGSEKEEEAGLEVAN